jgi:uncharacterized membrane protein
VTLARLRLSITSGLWFVPVLCVAVGALVSFGTLAVDRASGYAAIPAGLFGGPDAAAAILQTIATSMVSLTALVLTITMVVVQLAMGQFSPRIVQRFLRDKPSQFAIGLFVATFVHAILALREVTNDGSGGGQVPGVAITTAFVLVVASIAVLVIYVHHIGQSLRVSALIELVGRDTRRLLDQTYPDRGPDVSEPSGSARLIHADRSGVIVEIGYAELIAEAKRTDCCLELVPSLGTFVPAEAPLFRVHGDRMPDEARVRDALVIKSEPTLDEDVAYGVRLLVDIAERSLADSPFQDPSTAVQAIDRLHDILRQLARRPFPDGRHRDEEGTVRLTVPVMSWDAYVHLAFDEIRMAGAASPQVSRRLAAALLDLRSRVPVDRRAVLDEQLRLLDERVRAAIPSEAEYRFMMAPDVDGIGQAAGAGAPEGSRS